MYGNDLANWKVFLGAEIQALHAADELDEEGILVPGVSDPAPLGGALTKLYCTADQHAYRDNFAADTRNI